MRPGECEGRGIGIDLLPTIRDLNRILEYSRKNLAYKANPPLFYDADKYFNPHMVRQWAGALIARNPQGRNPLEALKLPEYPEVLEHIRDLRQVIRDGFQVDPIGEVNTPVKSATEVSIRKNRALKEKYKVPENYVVREVSLPETVINDLQQLAKSAGFNQEQFDKTIVSIHEQKKQQQTQLESKKQQLGDQLKVVEDYVMKNYPHALYDTILTTLLGDENAMSDAMKHRDQVLNSQVPGLNNQRGNFSDTYDGKAELINLAREYEKNPTEINKKRYINLAREVAEKKE